MEIKALVVDNNPVLLRAVAAILSQEGCVVRTAATGLEALEIVVDFCPDIVFTDLIMPMVSGEQLCRILRNTKKHEGVFIVVLSAIIIEDRERILREVQCDVCIAKGNLQDVRTHVREALQAFIARNNKISNRTKKAARIPAGLTPSEMTSELLLEKHHFLDILTNIEEGIIELNHQGKVVSANKSALNILSCREEMLVGVSLPQAVDWGEYNKAIQQWTEEQLIALGMGKYDILEDAPLFFDDMVVTASFIPVSVSGSVFGLCILHDISKQFEAEKYHKELDSAIRLVKNMEAMSCMAGGFSHDFNNLLTVICGNIDIITMQGERQSNDERERLLNQAKKAALVAVDLTRQISGFSNFGIVNRENVIVEELVRNTADQFFIGLKNSCRITATSKESLVRADPEELSQAIVNVLKNAREASSEQGVEIIIGENQFTAPQLMSGQYVPAGKYVRIDICDTGRGIHSDQLFRIFDPYYSTKERGTVKGMGLGLTVVYAILRNHGGFVVVSSKPNQGTTVSLFLPALQDSSADTLSEEAILEENRFVLLIEPEKQMREIGKIMLEYLGFMVRVAGNSSEAIHELKKFADDPLTSRPLVILALSSKNGESAVETCRLLHEIDPEIKVIAMSGTILDPIMENYRDYGFINTLPKPFSMDNLKHIINTVIHT
jgi:signal transduction histidine kinase/DNA-binding response OmpR family regulator